MHQPTTKWIVEKFKPKIQFPQKVQIYNLKVYCGSVLVQIRTYKFQMETKKNKNLKFLMNFEFISRRETIP